LIANVGGRRTLTALAFLILGSLTEGISILLLIPLLHLIGKADQDYAVRVPEALQWLVPGGNAAACGDPFHARGAGGASSDLQPLQVGLHGAAASTTSSTASA